MWATEYVARLGENLRTTKTASRAKLAWLGSTGVQASNAYHRAVGNSLPLPGVKHTVPWGILPLVGGGALVGAAAHGAGQDDAKKTLEDAGTTPSELARADYLAPHPREGYGVGRAIGSGLVGAGAGIGTSLALQHAAGVNPTLGRGVGLAAGLGAAYMHARHSANADERNRLKGGV